MDDNINIYNVTPFNITNDVKKTLASSSYVYVVV